MISVHGCPVIQAGEKDAGGMNIYVLEIAKKLADMGALVDVYTRHHDPSDPLLVYLSEKARVLHMPAGPPTIGKQGVFELLGEFTKQINEFTRGNYHKYDVIASHYWLSGIVGETLKDLWNIPHVTSFHTLSKLKQLARPNELEHSERINSERQIARFSDGVIAWTEHEQIALIDLYQAPNDHVYVIPPGVDSSKFKPNVNSDARSELNFGNQRAILFVGRLERLKGIDILIKALAQLKHKDGIKLFIAGGNANSSEMIRLLDEAQRLKVNDSVVFLGSISADILCKYYNAADVCVLPSYYESFGLAALEASACGTPVVASRVGGLTTVVKDKETGFLIPWQSPDLFVEKINLLLNNDKLRIRMGISARSHAEKFSWDATAEKILKVYTKISKSKFEQHTKKYSTA